VDQAKRFAERGFSFQLFLGRAEEEQDGFAVLMQVHSGDDTGQLIVGRWEDHLIVMNGDDYNHRRRLPRLSAKLAEGTNGVHSITVSSGDNGTSIHLNGERVASSEKVALKIPAMPLPGRIVLGNTVRGTHSWQGSIREFQFFDKVLSDEEIRRDVAAEEDSLDDNWIPSASDRLLIRWRMKTLSDHQVLNEAVAEQFGDGLNVPAHRVVVDPLVLDWPFGDQFEWKQGFFRDAGINLFGLIPCGFVIAWSGVRWGGLNRFSTTIIIVALMSLTIELLQGWMPSRVSSALDLTLNAVGGACGVGVAAFWMRARTNVFPRSSATSVSPDSILGDSSEQSGHSSGSICRRTKSPRRHSRGAE